jgi:methionyl-tRNA synthetase
MVGRLNGDLANDFGNLAQRVLSMINRNCAGTIPEPGMFATADERLLAEARGLLERIRPLLAEQAFHIALETIWRVVGEANRYIDEQAPWVLRRSDPKRMQTVLYTLADVLRHLGILVQPFMPAAADALLDQLAVPAEARNFAKLTQSLPSGRAVPAPWGIFPRFVDGETAG